MKRFVAVSTLMALAAMLCAVGAPAQAQDNGPSPRGRGNGYSPVLTSLSPDSAAHGGPAFTLTVNGGNLYDGVVARWNGAALSTTWLNNGQLKATIPASYIAKAGSAGVTVTDQFGTSNELTFTIN
jgi:hypothetical protein